MHAIKLAPLALGLAALLSGCGPQHDAPPISAAPPARPVAAPAPPKPLIARASPVERTPVKDAVTSLLEQDGQSRAPIFPAGLKLLSARKDHKGVVTLDFSSEFNGLEQRGESGEADAQKALRAAMASIPTVEMLRVLVEGKPFQSEATDWNTPFPVRGPARREPFVRQTQQ